VSPDLSVIVPTFRRNTELREALDSVLGQAHSLSIEVLVLDDSPEGGAREVVEAVHDPRVTYTKRAQPSGGKPALVRNDGLALARGRYLHFLDDDDRVAPGAHLALVRALDAQPERGVAFGLVEPFGVESHGLTHERAYFADAARRARHAAATGSRRAMVANMLFKATVLVNSACVIRRECARALGGYDPRLRVVEDVDMYVRAIRRFGYVFLDRPVVQYRFTPTSLMHREPDDRATLDSYAIMYGAYRASYGAAEMFALKLFARSVLRFV
jgi:glycosyltransferase involved in cell wall biosynthesis